MQTRFDVIIAQIKAVKTVQQAIKVSEVQDLPTLREGIKQGVFEYYQGINCYYVKLKE